MDIAIKLNGKEIGKGADLRLALKNANDKGNHVDPFAIEALYSGTKSFKRKNKLWEVSDV